jgi:segregation and condensation protein A
VPLQTTLDLPVFQGPLDLLLSLIERRRLAITDVSLASVADQYLQAVRALPRLEAELLAEFLVIGARLLVLKSRALLPGPPAVDEDEPIDDLADRLQQYRQLKEAALQLAARVEAAQQAFPHPARPALQDVQAPLAPIEAALLARLCAGIFARQAPPLVDETPPVTRVAVADRLAALRAILASGGELRWPEIAGRTLDEIIATLLAILELVRRSELRVVQVGCFGPIRLEAYGRPAVASDGEGVNRQPEQLG